MLYNQIRNALALPTETQPEIIGNETLPSWFDVTGLAVQSVAAAGAALAGYIQQRSSGAAPAVTVDQRLACLWFEWSLRPMGWQMPPSWDAIAGDYATADGWIKLHTNAPHHRAAALSVLGNLADRDAVATAVATWDGAELEAAIVDAGGCAAQMRSHEEWLNHPQGQAVATEPLIQWVPRENTNHSAPGDSRDPGRPLANIRVLDLTRVLAGPVAGRYLAAYGANVLRIDPPSWDEPGVVPEVTLGKRCAGLDLKTADGRATFESLLRDADLLLHGYRPDALIGLGYDPQRLHSLNPGLVDVSLCAYGWTGPWRHRRGFDSLVQMSSGIAEYGMRQAGADVPTPLPVQALDHATGYLMAAAALQGLRQRVSSGQASSAKLSLARVAHMLASTKREQPTPPLAERSRADVAPEIEHTSWGDARRVRFPVNIAGIDARWDYPATKLRTSPAAW